MRFGFGGGWVDWSDLEMRNPHFNYMPAQDWTEQRGHAGDRGETVEVAMTGKQVEMREFLHAGGRMTDWIKANPVPQLARNGFDYITERFGPPKNFWEGVEHGTDE